MRAGGQVRAAGGSREPLQGGGGGRGEGRKRQRSHVLWARGEGDMEGDSHSSPVPGDQLTAVLGQASLPSSVGREGVAGGMAAFWRASGLSGRTKGSN